MAAPANSVWIGYLGTAKIVSSGTSITFPGQILVPDGAVGTPSYSFTASPASGFYSPGTNEVAASINGVAQFDIANNQLRLISSLNLGWSSGDPTAAASDVILTRGAANRLTLAAGDVFNLAPTAFASLPTGAEGSLACVTDSNTATWGATIAGGGANNVLAFFNGTNWTVAGA